MGTWLSDLQKTNPRLAADYAVVGNQSYHCLHNMVCALSMLRMLNTPDDERRLAAAKRILRARNMSKTKGQS